MYNILKNINMDKYNDIFVLKMVHIVLIYLLKDLILWIIPFLLYNNMNIIILDKLIIL